MRRTKSVIISLLVTLVTCLGLSFVGEGIAHAGTIGCGDQSGPLVRNRTNPNSQVWFDVSGGCGTLQKILTISGDNIYTDSHRAANMILDPRVACDVYMNNTFYTFRNYNYGSKIYVTVDTAVWTVTLCNYF